jgi:glyoxylase-like metal-dependent hydrolase (beta-lactamase superfamily II)
MFFRQLLNDETACASYVFGCKSKGVFAVAEPHADLVDEYIAIAERQGARIAGAFETHIQADHVSGLPELVRRTGATAYLPQRADIDIDHTPLADGETVVLGNTAYLVDLGDGRALAVDVSRDLRALRAAAGRRGLRIAYVVTDRTRGDDPWFVLTGDALLVGDAGRPDLHAHGEHTVEEMARALYRSLTEQLLALPDHLVLYPSHYSGSVCGRGLSANPISTIGFERAHNRALAHDSEAAFVAALIEDIPPAPAHQAEIVAANRAGRPLTPAP